MRRTILTCKVRMTMCGMNPRRQPAPRRFVRNVLAVGHLQALCCVALEIDLNIDFAFQMRSGKIVRCPDWDENL